MLKIVNRFNKELWNLYVNQSVNFDFYVLWEYLDINFENSDFHEFELIIWENLDQFIGFPVFYRKILTTVSHIDAVSMYGYTNLIHRNCTEDFLVESKKQIFSYLVDKGCVSGYFRLHPILTDWQSIFFNNLIGVQSKLICIDLRKPVLERYKEVRQNRRTAISQLKRKGAKCYFTMQLKHIDDFFEIYDASMKRLNAKEAYRFDKKYFYRILSEVSFIRLCVCELEGIIIGGALFGFTGDIVQYHLSGTLDTAIRLSPSSLIIDFVGQWSADNGFKTFNLGGGYGASESDSLFEFKRGFSDLRVDYRVVKTILNQEVYDELCIHLGIRDDFFPAYYKG